MRSTMTLAALGVFVLACPALSGAASAQDVKLDCKNAQTQVEMTSCAGIAFDDADKALNQLWPSVVANARDRDKEQGKQMRDLGLPTTVEALRAAERAWIAYRDAECSYEAYKAFGGTMQPMLGTQCRTRLTKAHIAELKQAIASQ